MISHADTKAPGSSPGCRGESPSEAVRASVEWIVEDVQCVAESFGLKPSELLGAVLREFELCGHLTYLRRH